MNLYVGDQGKGLLHVNSKKELMLSETFLKGRRKPELVRKRQAPSTGNY